MNLPQKSTSKDARKVFEKELQKLDLNGLLDHRFVR